MNKHTEIELLSIILDCGSLDIQYFINKLNEFNESDINPEIDFYDVYNTVRKIEYNVTINGLIYYLHEAMFLHIIKWLKEQCEERLNDRNKHRVIEYLDEMDNNFNPFINCMDSHFNNWLDEVELNSDDLWKELIKQVTNE